MPFTQKGPNASADLGNYNDVQRNQDNTFSRTIGTIIHGNQNPTYRADTINIFNMGSDSVAEPSVKQILQAVAGPSNETSSVTAQHPLRRQQQQVISAADDTSRLIVSIVRLLANRMESFDGCRDLKLSLELLYRTMVMSRLAALEIFGPRGCDLARTIEPAILECCATLQELFVKLESYQEGLSIKSILWNRTPRIFDNQELCWIKKRLETHLVVLMESLALHKLVRPIPLQASREIELKSILAFHGRTSPQHVTYLSQLLFHPASTLTIFVACILETHLVLG